jgi:hypothetical protein
MKIRRFVLPLLTTACTVQYSQFKTPSGATHYNIICGNELERCESKAKELCPNGFERFGSMKRSTHDAPRLLVRTETEYELDIECDDRPR